VRTFSVAVTLLLLSTVAACHPLRVSVNLDTDAFPIVVNVSIVGGSSPFEARTSVVDYFGQKSSTELGEVGTFFSFPVLTNPPQYLSITVKDAEGTTAQWARSIGKRVETGEVFKLDARRYTATTADGSWEQIRSMPDEFLCSDSPVRFLSQYDGIALCVATWPGVYVFHYADAHPLIIVVKPADRPAPEIRGMCDDYTPRPLGFTHMEFHLQRMRKDGINAVQFIRMFTMKDVHDTQIYDPCRFPYWDDELRCAIRKAKSEGFIVMLRLVLFLEAEWPGTDALTGQLEPRNWEEWFSNFESVVLRYAELAEEEGVAIYQFAESLHTTYRFESRYRNLIKKIRDCYHGKLIVTTGSWFDGALSTVNFWDALDYIGITGSLKTQSELPYDKAIKANTDAVFGAYETIFLRELLPTVRKWDRKILWSEVYYRSVVGSTYSPNGIPNWGQPGADYHYNAEPSYAEQAKGYDATLRLIHRYRGCFGGMFALQWCMQDPIWLENNTYGGHNIYSTPSERLFYIWWNPPDDIDGQSTVVPDRNCLEFDDFSWSGFRGFWGLDAFGSARGHWESCEPQPDDPGGHRFLRFEFENPNGDFLRLRFTFNPNPSVRDLSGYAGIAFVAEAEEPVELRIELSFGEWIPSFSSTITVQGGPRIYTVPFFSFSVPEKERLEFNLEPGELILDQCCGISFWPISSRRAIILHDLGAYK